MGSELQKLQVHEILEVWARGISTTLVGSGRSKGVLVRNSFLSLTSSLVSGLPPWPRAFLEAFFLLVKRMER